MGAHKPIYKWSVDEIEPDGWEAHFVWLRSPHFNYAGKVYWEFSTRGGSVDVLFLDWEGYQNFRNGTEFQTLVDSLETVTEGSQGVSGLNGDLPYFLVIRNPSPIRVTAEWKIYADIDWRRWEGQTPGPMLNLTFEKGSPLLAQGESWETTFSNSGFYRYYCGPHADMTALIEVTPSGVPGPRVEVAIREFGFHPEIIHIAQGTTINWTNHDGIEHSVQIELLPEGISPAQSTPPLGSILQSWWPVAIVSAAVAVAFFFIWRRRRLLRE